MKHVTVAGKEVDKYITIIKKKEHAKHCQFKDAKNNIKSQLYQNKKRC